MASDQNASFSSPAAEVSVMLMQVAEVLAPIGEFISAYYSTLLEGGIDEDIAGEMCVNIHSDLTGLIMDIIYSSVTDRPNTARLRSVRQ